MYTDNYPPGFDQSLLDDDEEPIEKDEEDQDFIFDDDEPLI